MTTFPAVILRSVEQRARAIGYVRTAPQGFVVRINRQTRSASQNDKMWAMLADVAKARPMGREHTPEVWKALFMHGCGHEVQFAEGLDGHPFPLGFRSSKLNTTQMADLIEFIYAWASEKGVRWSEQYE